MKNGNKTKEKLINELEELRQRIPEFGRGRNRVQAGGRGASHMGRETQKPL